jgi:hypothetical protein
MSYNLKQSLNYTDISTNAVFKFKGYWDADGNTPDIGTTVTKTGEAYIVSVDGSTSLGGITTWVAGDVAVKIETGWLRIDNVTYADAGYEATVDSHIANLNNPHGVTKLQLGLEFVINTGDGTKVLLNNGTYASVNTAQLANDAVTLDKIADANIQIGGVGDNTKLTTKGYVDEVVSSGMRLMGDWNADTNTPDLTLVTTTGNSYRVSTAGATDLGGITDWAIGDIAVKTGTLNGWLKIDNTDTEATWGQINGTLANQTDLQSALNGKSNVGHNHDTNYADISYEGIVDSHLLDTDNPHMVTKAQVGLGNCDNTSDLNKPISTAVELALALKEPLLPSKVGHAGEVLTVNIDEDGFEYTSVEQLHTHNNFALLETLVENGDGLQFLANDGEYKIITDSGSTAYKREFTMIDWSMPYGETLYEIVIDSDVHQQVSKYIEVVMYEDDGTNNNSVVADYRVSDTGDVVVYTTAPYAGHMVIYSFNGVVGDGVAWGNITGDLVDQTDLVAEFATKEDAFTKNTAFNKNFGTTAGTVAEGNHDHDDVYEPLLPSKSGNAGEALVVNATEDGFEYASLAQLHTHNNFALLETYTNSNADISDAIAKEHVHDNKAVLDGIIGNGDGNSFLANNGTYKQVDTDQIVAEAVTLAKLDGTMIQEGTTGDNTKLTTKGYVDEMVNSAFILQGDWNASTNTPSLTTGTPVVGDAYRVSTSGTTNLGGITDWVVNDLAIYTAGGWIKIDNSDTEAVWGNITGTLSNQTDLQTALNGKSDITHTHASTDLTDSANIARLDADNAFTGENTMSGSLTMTGTEGTITVANLSQTEIDALTPSTGMIVYNETLGKFQIYQGTAWATTTTGSIAWGAITGSIGDQTDLQNALDAKVDKTTTVNGQALSANVVLDADDIDDSTTVNKFMTQAEIDKLAGIETGAQVNDVTSVAGRTGDVVLTKSDVGLNNVDNTADLDKPISTATQTALNNKEDLITKGAIYANQALVLNGTGTAWTYASLTDLHNHTNKTLLDTITDQGDGTQALLNNGTYAQIDTPQLADDAVTIAKIDDANIATMGTLNNDKLATQGYVDSLSNYLETTTVSADTTLTTSNHVVLVNAGAGDVTISLPTAVNNTGLHFIIKKLDASENLVIINADGVEVIDESITAEIDIQFDAFRIVSDGSNWQII